MAAVFSSHRLAVLGVGVMGSALVRGFLRAGLLSPPQVWAVDLRPEALQRLREEWDLHTTSQAREAVQEATILVVAVKPGEVPALLADVAPALRDSHLCLSIAAGVPLRKLDAWAQGKGRWVRLMPNTPALVGAGATAYTLGPRTQPEDREIVETLFRAVGRVVEVKEEQMDAVTGLSGSGPAFVYIFIEALADAGVRAGLPRGVALELAAQTVLGAARMVLESGQHPAALKDAVASPGGTTIAGIEALERHGFRFAAFQAVLAATRRSQELA